MLETRLFKIKPGKLDLWKSWSLELRDRKAEVLETLREERVLLEGGGVFTVGEENFVLLFIYHEEEILPTTQREINLKHNQMKRECLEHYGELSNLYYFKI